MQQQTFTPKVAHSTPMQKLPTLHETEDFEGTEALLRAEISEGWQKPKGDRE